MLTKTCPPATDPELLALLNSIRRRESYSQRSNVNGAQVVAENCEYGRKPDEYSRGLNVSLQKCHSSPHSQHPSVIVGDTLKIELTTFTLAYVNGPLVEYHINHCSSFGK